MIRKVRFQRLSVFEIKVDVPDDIAKGPDERRWLAENMSAHEGTEVGESYIQGMVVAQPADDMTNTVLW